MSARPLLGPLHYKNPKPFQLYMGSVLLKGHTTVMDYQVRQLTHTCFSILNKDSHCIMYLYLVNTIIKYDT